MKVYHTKIPKLSGTDYREIYSKAYGAYKKIKARSKRRPYLRSAYFKKGKVFLELFWVHLQQKPWKERDKRLKYLLCAFDLIQHSSIDPTSKENPNKPHEIFHRFFGVTPQQDEFFVQIKENKKTDQKWFMSVFSPRGK